MRRPHPYLAIALVCAAVVLVTFAALACPASAQAWSTTPAPRRTPTPTPEGCAPIVNGQPVMPGSVECSPYTTQLNVPPADRVGLIRYMTVRIIQQDISDGALTTPASSAVRNAYIADAFEIEPRFLDRPLWGKYAVPPSYTPNCGSLWCGCASGIGSWPPKVDASDVPSRVEQLISWELTNALLGKLNRADLFDGAYVSSVVSRVGQQIGGWSQ